MFDGCGFIIDGVGPKDALITMVHVPFAKYPYFRTAMRGVYVAGAELFTRKAYVREVPRSTPHRSIALRISLA